MPTQILKMLTDGSGRLDDEVYNSMEVETRAALIALFVRPECTLTFSEAACEHNDAAEDKTLYLGSHECGERTVSDTDDIYIELWAWILDNGNDAATWQITTLNNSQHPIRYCPFCGSDLLRFVIEDLTTEELSD